MAPGIGRIGPAMGLWQWQAGLARSLGRPARVPVSMLGPRPCPPLPTQRAESWSRRPITTIGLLNWGQFVSRAGGGRSHHAPASASGAGVPRPGANGRPLRGGLPVHTATEPPVRARASAARVPRAGSAQLGRTWLGRRGTTPDCSQSSACPDAPLPESTSIPRVYHAASALPRHSCLVPQGN
jgi:hypothetical protein